MMLRSVAFEIFYGWYGITFFKTYFREYFEFGVVPGFFADPANTYPDLLYELLKLDQCANAVIGQK